MDFSANTDELLTEQGILEQQFRFGACQIERKGKCGRGLGQLGPIQVARFKPSEQAGKQLGAEGKRHEKELR